MKNLKSTKSLIAFFALIQLCFFPLLSYSQSRKPVRLVSGQENSSQVYQNAKISATVSRPGNSQNFSFSTGSWQPAGSSTYGYDSNGRLTYRLNLNVSGQNLSRQYYTYDADNFITEYFTDVWRNNMWNPGYGYRYLDTYNSFGNLSESIYQERGGTIWLNKTRWVINYNAQQIQSGQETSDWDDTLNTWVPEYRAVNYVYNANNDVTSYVEEKYVNGSWQNNLRFTNLTWQKKNDYMLTFSTESWQNGLWQYGMRFAKVFGIMGSYTETWQGYQNGNWVNLQIAFYDQDSLGNELGGGSYTWQNGAWTIFQHHKHLLTYNANQDVTERISQLRQYISPNYTNETKWVYSNFQYFTIAGVKNGIPQEIAANAFPNPVDKLLTIELSEKATSLTAQLSDVTGKLILSRKFLASETKQLQLETLKPGIYLLTLQTEQGKTVRKIVKN